MAEEFEKHGAEQQLEFSAFDDELDKFADGKIAGNHIFNLGKPGEILQKCGFPKDHRVELSGSRLMMKSKQRNHPFDITDVKGLDKAIQNPVAVFEYGNKAKSQNIIVELQKDGKNFLVGVFFNQKQRGYEVSDIRGLFNKDNIKWLRWIEQGKMIYGDKEKIQVLAAQQRTNLAEVNHKEVRTSSDSYYLDSVDSIMQKFGDVKDIYTENFEFYNENKERYKIFKAFRDIYQELESIETADAPMLAKEFYEALKNDDTRTLLKYTDGEMYPEIAEKAGELVRSFNLEHNRTQESYGNALKNTRELNGSSAWETYVSLVKSFLPKADVNDKEKVLEASKLALAFQTDMKGAMDVINKEFEKRGVKDEASLVRAIKDVAYPELLKKNRKDFDRSR